MKEQGLIMGLLNKLEETGEMELFIEKTESFLDNVDLNRAFNDWLDEKYDLSNAGDIFCNLAASEVLYDYDLNTYERERDYWIEDNESLIEINGQFYWIDDIAQSLEKFNRSGAKLERIKLLLENLRNKEPELFNNFNYSELLQLERIVS